jgi:hypothetical protein
MTVVLLLLALSALIGFGLGTWFRWPAIVASSVALAVFSSAILQIQGFGTLPGIASVVACLTVSQMGYLAAASLRHPGYLKNKPTRNQAKVATTTSATRTKSTKGPHLRK